MRRNAVKECQEVSVSRDQREWGKGLETHQQFYDSENRELKQILKNKAQQLKLICLFAHQSPDDSSDRRRVYFESKKTLFNLFMRERNNLEKQSTDRG